MPFIKYYNLYVPIHQGTNSYRHYGIKQNKILFFELHEIIHILNSDYKKDYPVYIKPYFNLKSTLNLLRPCNIPLEHVLIYNNYLFSDMSKTCWKWMNKYITQNSKILEWKDVSLDMFNQKERKIFEPLFYKLKDMEPCFIRCSNLLQQVNFNKITWKRKQPSSPLFCIPEIFNCFNIPKVDVSNEITYLRTVHESLITIDLLKCLYFDVYNTTNNFNRNRTNPISRMVYINKYVKVSQLKNFDRKMVCLVSNDECVILKVCKQVRLNLQINDKLIKKQ